MAKPPWTAAPDGSCGGRSPTRAASAAAREPAPTGVRRAFGPPHGPGAGQVQVGVARGPGFSGAPICAADPNAPVSQTPYEDAARDREAAAQTSRDIRRNTIDALTRMVAFSKKMQESMKDIDPNLILPVSDPDYEKGYWTFPGETRRKARPSEYCRMIFASTRGVVGVFGPGGDYRGAMLIFWGESIPKPKETRLASVSLSQNDEPTAQTVKADNYTEPNGDIGAIAFGVPTVEALIGTMEEQQTFRVAMDGKTVADMFWSSGIAGRNALKRCEEAGRR